MLCGESKCARIDVRDGIGAHVANSIDCHSISGTACYVSVSAQSCGPVQCLVVVQHLHQRIDEELPSAMQSRVDAVAPRRKDPTTDTRDPHLQNCLRDKELPISRKPTTDADSPNDTRLATDTADPHLEK